MKSELYSNNLESRAEVFKALGDPIRLTIYELVQLQDLSPDAIAEQVELASNLLAHHLKILEKAGLIRRTQSEGDKRRSYISAEALNINTVVAQSLKLKTPRVVFVCTANSARSILANAIWQYNSHVPSTSAGTKPARWVHPRTEKLASKLGLTGVQRTPQALEDVLKPNDLVVSVCDAVNEELAELPNKRIHWSIPDPAKINTDKAFRDAFDEIAQRIARLANSVN